MVENVEQLIESNCKLFSKSLFTIRLLLFLKSYFSGWSTWVRLLAFERAENNINPKGIEKTKIQRLKLKGATSGCYDSSGTLTQVTVESLSLPTAVLHHGSSCYNSPEKSSSQKRWYF